MYFLFAQSFPIPEFARIRAFFGKILENFQGMLGENIYAKFII